MKNGIRN